MRPDLVASGLGLASRAEICGLVSMFEAAGMIEVARGFGESLARRIGLEIEGAEARMTEAAEALARSSIPDDVLRHRLWFALVRALETDEALPLSERRLAEEAGALGVIASRVLSPGLHAEARQKKRQDDNRTGFADRVGDRVREAWKEPSRLWRGTPPLPFPDIVAREFAALLDGFGKNDPDAGFDPQISDALRRGGRHAWTAIAAGGGWVGMAAAVNASGFAPYILAAQASAYLPFVGGPAAVSFLAVMVNPVTVAAGVLALGGLGGRRIARTAQRQVAARIAVLLAVRGIEAPRSGLGRTATGFRWMCREIAGRPDHLSGSEWQALRSRVARIEALIGTHLPDAAGMPPGRWAEAPAVSRTSAPILEAMATGGITAADMLFHAAAMDLRVLAAAGFWRNAEIEDPLDFALYAAEFAVRGADIALRGFTAEQVVMGRLIADGHDVSLPDSSSNPGFDLFVDGHEVQVKCAESTSVLEEHFGLYPEIPVIANAELVDRLTDEPWAELVTAIEGYDLAAVEDLTERAVEAGLDLTAPDLLAAAISVGALRGAFGLMSGEIPAEHLPAWLVVDAALRGGLVVVGGNAGTALGLIVIGPAGALILGPAMGAATILGVGRARAVAERFINSDWHRSMRDEAETLRQAVLRDLEARIGLLVRRRSALRRAAVDRPGELSEWIDRRATDDAIAAAESLVNLGKPPSTQFEAMRLDVLAARAAPADPEVLRPRRVLRERFSGKPGPLDGVLQNFGRLGVPVTRNG